MPFVATVFQGSSRNNHLKSVISYRRCYKSSGQVRPIPYLSVELSRLSLLLRPAYGPFVEIDPSIRP